MEKEPLEIRADNIFCLIIIWRWELRSDGPRLNLHLVSLQTFTTTTTQISVRAVTNLNIYQIKSLFFIWSYKICVMYFFFCKIVLWIEYLERSLRRDAFMKVLSLQFRSLNHYGDELSVTSVTGGLWACLHNTSNYDRKPLAVVNYKVSLL